MTMKTISAKKAKMRNTMTKMSLTTSIISGPVSSNTCATVSPSTHADHATSRIDTSGALIGNPECASQFNDVAKHTLKKQMLNN